MNPINEEENEQRVPLMPSDLKSSKENCHIPYADETSHDESSHNEEDHHYHTPPLASQINRKTSLSGRRNVELSLHIEPARSETSHHNGDGTHETPKTASDGSNSMDTPPLPLPRALRRNSISMPSGINALEELEALRVKHQMQEQEPVEEEEKSPSPTDSVSVHVIKLYKDN